MYITNRNFRVGLRY